MYRDCSDAFNTAVASNGRTFVVKIAPTIGTQEPITEGIFAVTLTRGSNAGESLTLGSAVAATLEVEMELPPYTLEDREIQLFMGIKIPQGIEYIPMGYYRAERPKKRGNKVTFSAYDRMIYKAENPYSSDLKYPATDLDALREICDQMGVGLDLGDEHFWLTDEDGLYLTDEDGVPLVIDEYDGSLYLTDEDGAYLLDEDGAYLALEFDPTTSLEAHIIQEPPTGYSYREMITIIAARHGKFACFDRSGNLTLRWWREAGQIDFDRTAEPEPGELDYTLGEISCAVADDTVLSAQLGSGAGRIQYTDPGITQDRLDNIISEIGGFAYRPGTLDLMLGDPRLDPWDMFTVSWDGDAYRMPAMTLIHKFDGGLSTAIEAVAESVSEQDYDYQGPTIKTIDQAVKVSNEAVERLRKSLTSEQQRAGAAEQALSESIKILQDSMEEYQEGVTDLQTDLRACAKLTDLVLSVDADSGQAVLSDDKVLALGLYQLLINFGQTVLQPCLSGGQRLYESGSAEIGDEGSVTIDLPETAQALSSPQYQVSVTQTGAGTIDYVNKQSEMFTVYGSPGSSFDWMLIVQIDQAPPDDAREE